MTQKLFLAAVLLCILTPKLTLIASQKVDGEVLDVNTPVPIEPLDVKPMSVTENPVLVHSVSSPVLKNLYDRATTTTTESSVYNSKQNDQGDSWLSRLWNRNLNKNNEPTLVVEVEDGSNDASLKIMHLPLVRYTKQETFSESTESQVPFGDTTTQKPDEETSTKIVRKRSISDDRHDNQSPYYKQQHDQDNAYNRQLNAAAYMPKSRKAGDVEFKIYDTTVIQALIDALRMVDPARAAMLQDNIYRVEIKVEIDDDDDDDDDDHWMDRMRYMLRDLPTNF